MPENQPESAKPERTFIILAIAEASGNPCNMDLIRLPNGSAKSSKRELADGATLHMDEVLGVADIFCRSCSFPLDEVRILKRSSCK